MPSALGFGDDLCAVLDHSDVQSLLGVDALEEIQLTPDDAGEGNWVCLLKLAGGDDQAPSFVVQITKGQTEAELRTGLGDKAYVTQQECAYESPEFGFAGANHCIGGLGEGTNTFNTWIFGGGDSYLCGGNAPTFTLTDFSALCRDQIALIG